MTIAGGTIISSLQSDRVTKKFGPGKVTAVSVLMTAIALFIANHISVALFPLYLLLILLLMFAMHVRLLKVVKKNI